MFEIESRNYSFEQSNNFHTELYEAFDSDDFKVFEFLEACFEGDEEFVGIDLEDYFVYWLRNSSEGGFDILEIICSRHGLCLRE